MAQQQNLKNMAAELLLSHPKRTIIVLLSLLIAAMLEGIGVAALIPVIGSFLGESSKSGKLGELLTSLFDFFHIPSNTSTILFAVFALILCKAVFTMIAMRNVGYASAYTATLMRMRYARALMGMKWGVFQSIAVGKITNAIGTEATRAARGYISLCRIFAEAAIILVYLVMVFLISWQMAALAVFVSLLMFVVLGGLVRMVKKAGHSQTRHMADLSHLISDFMSSVKMIKATAQERHFTKILKKEAKNVQLSRQKIVFGNQALIALREPIAVGVLIGGICLLSSYSDLSTAGNIAFSLMFFRIIQKITNLQVLYQSLMMNESAFWALHNATLEAEKEPEIWEGTAEPELKKQIEFNDIHFSHQKNEESDKTLILNGVSSSFAAKKFHAIIGPSGSGKTTLVDLLLGFYKPDSGEVIIDGKPLSELNMDQWRHMVGYVPQEAPMLHDTIRNNITMGDEDIHEDRIVEALDKAGALAFVMDTPDGLDEVVGERGLRFSGGQRQRLAIARALVKNPALLILDEATSALDTETEDSILQMVQKLSKDMTVIAISHNETIKNYVDNVFSIKN
ncbi:MAG: ABC transporter ATP-binding protein [Alphaproteobacteria bacterium]|nr:ABC transporter ATP-binding protein [Alphaproteobacteria bacterium]